MLTLFSDNLWHQIKRFSKAADHREAAVAFVSTDEGVTFRQGDMLVVDASDEAVHLRQTSATVLASAVKAGARVFSVKGLHAKVMVFDRVAIVGSANISGSSQENLIEAGVVTDHPETLSVARSFIRQLCATGEKVDRKFIKRISAIPLAAIERKSRTDCREKVSLATPSAWLVSVREMEEAEHPEEERWIAKGAREAEKLKSEDESDTGWLRFTGKSSFRREARDGDTVIRIWKAYKDREPNKVLAHSPILRRQDEPNCTRFFVEEFNDSEERSISWKRFRKLAKNVGVADQISPYAVRKLSPELSQALHALWKT